MILEAPNLTVSTKSTLPGVPFLAIKEKILGKGYDLSISFVSSKDALALNSAHRGKDYVPNTLSFSLSKKSGEIILCMSAIRNEYRSFGMTLQKYLVFLVIHSCLHLKGYAHGGTMERKEKELLALFA